MKNALYCHRSFGDLVGTIRRVHEELAVRAGRVVNFYLTLRNWLIGYYISEYELNGSDRAAYGESLLKKMATDLNKKKVSTCGKRQLYQYLRFYQTYPLIMRSLPAQLKLLIPAKLPIKTKKVRSVTALSDTVLRKMLQTLSYTHIEQFVSIEDQTKRDFYTIECINGNWSVRELKRQIASLYYERSDLSQNKKKLSGLVRQNAETTEPGLVIRDPYVFEFLGLKPEEVMSESHLEDQLLDKLRKFLLELGHGFCFEARQKRILIGNTFNFIDLVFYNRLLKCHVLVELKLEAFNHENIGQLNTYLSWFKKNMKQKGDNPPVGILLCTEKDHVLVEYALAGLDNRLFVSKYMLELPKKKEMQRFLDQQIKQIKGRGSDKAK
jgi:predicted nuclease of restriction endonuclease-like (RecB) superfamily